MSGGPLFAADYRERPTVIGQATEQELAAIMQPVATGACHDRLEYWTLVAARDPVRPSVDVHALGWRAKLRSTCIASPMAGVDITGKAAAIWSDHMYLMRQPDGPDLEPELWRHRADALQTRCSMMSRIGKFNHGPRCGEMAMSPSFL